VLTSDDLLTLAPTATATTLRPDEIGHPDGTSGGEVDSPGTRSRDGLIVAGFVVVATLLRVPTLGRSYWVDEAISVGIASHPVTQIPALLRDDGSPPLWYFLLHFWMLAAGSSPVATHVLALLVSLVVTPLAYWAGRQLFGRPAALCAAALSATSPFLNWYGTENRMYTLVVAISLVAVTLTVRAVRDRSRRDAIGAVVAFAALDYTHNWGLYLTAVTVLYLAGRALAARDRGLLAWVLGGGAAVVLLYLPWLPSFLEQASTTAAPWAVAPLFSDLVADPTTLVGGTAGAVVAPVLVGAVLWTRGRRTARTSQAATVLVSITLGVTVLGWLAAQIEPSWTVRYLAVTLAGWILAAAGALGASRTGRRVVVAVTVGLATWSVVGALLPDANPDAAKDNAGAIAGAAAPLLHAGDLVVVSQTEQVPVLAHYLPAGLTYFNPMGRGDAPSVVDWRHIIPRLQQADACRTIEPAVNAAPVGTRILEVLPLDPVGAPGSAWSRAAHRQVMAIDALLGRDRSLQLQRSFTEAIDPKPYSPVIAVLFVKVSDHTSCA
jgi:mannosyltransferase